MHDFTSLTIIALLCAGLALSTASSDAREKDPPRGFIAKTMKMDGKEIKYVVYVPAAYDAKKPMPTIIFLNGYGECGTDGWKQVYHFGGAIMLSAEKWPFLVLFPQKQYALDPSKEPNPWEDQDPMVMAILEKSEREYNIDKSRIYLTGLSQGGHGTWAIAAKHPDIFAAIAPVCGWADKETAQKLAKMPIRIFHGDADQAVNVQCSLDMEKWIKEAGGSCDLKVYPGVGHNSWDKAYREEDLGAWFLQHHR